MRLYWRGKNTNFFIRSYMRKRRGIRQEHAAAYFNYSTSYFSRMVKRNTGCNFTELLVKYRLELACRLLRESRLKVGEICEIIGYRNLEHFNRQFRKEFDRTPTQYRREHRDNVKKNQI